jgi:hypothetical protein
LLSAHALNALLFIRHVSRLLTKVPAGGSIKAEEWAWTSSWASPEAAR